MAFWMDGNRVLAGMNVIVWDVVDPIRALVLSGSDIDARLTVPMYPGAAFSPDATVAGGRTTGSQVIPASHPVSAARRRSRHRHPSRWRPRRLSQTPAASGRTQ